MPGLEPLAPHRRPSSPRGMRWRFFAAALVTVALMVAVVALLMWLPIV